MLRPKTPVLNTDTLKVGDSLQANQQIACDGVTLFIMQDDGNLVLYQTNADTGADGNVVLWATGTTESGDSGIHLDFQGDGNVVLYADKRPSQPTNPVLWATNTSSAVELVAQCDCNVVLRDASGNSLWATNTGCQIPVPSPSSPGPSPTSPGPSPSVGPLPPVPDKIWFGWWGGAPDNTWDKSIESASLLFDPIPADNDIDQLGGSNGVRFLYPAFMFFCQEQAMTGACTLFSDYQSRWATAIPKLTNYLRHGKILGFNIGDERICGTKQKSSVADWNTIISTIRASFPRGQAIIYTNECASSFEDGTPIKTIPDGLDWISFDHYRSNKDSGFIDDLRKRYEENLYPKLASHQMVSIIPEVTCDDKKWDDCDSKCCAKVELQDAKDAMDWQSKDSRIAFINPYRLDDLVNNKYGMELYDYWKNVGQGTK